MKARICVCVCVCNFVWLKDERVKDENVVRILCRALVRLLQTSGVCVFSCLNACVHACTRACICVRADVDAGSVTCICAYVSAGVGSNTCTCAEVEAIYGTCIFADFSAGLHTYICKAVGVVASICAAACTYTGAGTALDDGLQIRVFIHACIYACRCVRKYRQNGREKECILRRNTSVFEGWGRGYCYLMFVCVLEQRWPQW